MEGARVTVTHKEISDGLERHFPDLNRRAMRLAGGNAANADDLVQKTALNALAGRKTCDLSGGRTMRSWLLTIMQNAWMDKGRHDSAEARRKRRMLESRTPGVASFASEAEEGRALSRLFLERVVPEIKNLSRRQREFLLIQIENEDMTHAEIAALHDVAPSTVQTHVYVARKRLGEALGL